MVSFQDNYTFAQPGIQNKVKALEELVSRIDGKWTPVSRHPGVSCVTLDFRLPVLCSLLKCALFIALYFGLVYYELIHVDSDRLF